MSYGNYKHQYVRNKEIFGFYKFLLTIFQTIFQIASLTFDIKYLFISDGKMWSLTFS